MHQLTRESYCLLLESVASVLCQPVQGRKACRQLQQVLVADLQQHPSNIHLQNMLERAKGNLGECGLHLASAAGPDTPAAGAAVVHAKVSQTVSYTLKQQPATNPSVASPPQAGWAWPRVECEPASDLLVHVQVGMPRRLQRTPWQKSAQKTPRGSAKTKKMPSWHQLWRS